MNPPGQSASTNDEASSRFTPLLARVRSLEHPGPYLSEAKDALMRIIALEKEILFNEAEERLQRQARRVVYTMAAVFAALLAANNVVFWIIWELRTS